MLADDVKSVSASVLTKLPHLAVYRPVWLCSETLRHYETWRQKSRFIELERQGEITVIARVEHRKNSKSERSETTLYKYFMSIGIIR